MRAGQNKRIATPEEIAAQEAGETYQTQGFGYPPTQGGPFFGGGQAPGISSIAGGLMGMASGHECDHHSENYYYEEQHASGGGGSGLAGAMGFGGGMLAENVLSNQEFASFGISQAVGQFEQNVEQNFENEYQDVQQDVQDDYQNFEQNAEEQAEEYQEDGGFGGYVEENVEDAVEEVAEEVGDWM